MPSVTNGLIAHTAVLTARVTKLLDDPKINKTSNDYKAYGRPGPGGGPGPLFGQQYKLGKAEGKALVAKINTTYTVATQKKIVNELHDRSSSRFPNKGTISLTRDGAAELNKLAKLLKLDIKFGYNQQHPVHPVG